MTSSLLKVDLVGEGAKEVPGRQPIAQNYVRFELLADAIAKLEYYLTESDWQLIDQSLTEMLWSLAAEKVRHTPDGRIKPKKKYRARRRCVQSQKEKARYLLHQAVQNGTVVKPKQCERCGSRKPWLHGHHEDYTKPLDVAWLCISCHAQEHKGERHTALLILGTQPLPRWSGK